MKSFKLYNPSVPTEEKVVKYLGILATLLLITPFGGFAVMLFPLSLVIFVPIFSIPFSKRVVKNKITRNIIIATDVFIIAIALYVDIYFIATGGTVVGL